MQGVFSDVRLAFFAEVVADILEFLDFLWLMWSLAVFAQAIAEAFPQQHLKIVTFGLAALKHKVVHVVPTRGELVFLGVALEFVNHSTGLVAFQHIVFVFDAKTMKRISQSRSWQIR